MTTLRSSLTLAVALVTLSACKDDPVGVNSGDPMTDAFTADDGRAGSCRFEVDFAATYDIVGASGSSSASGTVCGVSVSGLSAFDAAAANG